MTNNTNDLVSMTTIFLSPKRYPTGVTIEINQTKGFEVSWDNQKVVFFLNYFLYQFYHPFFLM